MDEFMWRLIRLLKKWNLWQSITVTVGGICYSDQPPEDRETPCEVKKGVYTTKCIAAGGFEHHTPSCFPLAVIDYKNSPLADLMLHGSYYADISKISLDAFDSMMVTENLRQRYKPKSGFSLCVPLQDEAEADTLYAEYCTYFSTPLECGEATVSLIKEELTFLCDRYNVQILLLDDSKVLIVNR